MAKGAIHFKKQLDEFVDEEVMGTALKLQRDIMLNLLAGIIDDTPVGKRDRWKVNKKRKERGLPGLVPPNYVGGHARKNWQLTINRKAVKELPGEDPSGQATIAKGEAVIATIDEPVIIYMTNLVPYIQRLEQGHSTLNKQFVAKNLQRIRNKFKLQG